MTNKINPKYIGSPLRLNIISSCVIWLMLDRLQVSAAVCAVIWTVWAFLVLCGIVAPFTETWMHPTFLPVDSSKKR